jgi:hypothetical protein
MKSYTFALKDFVNGLDKDTAGKSSLNEENLISKKAHSNKKEKVSKISIEPNRKLRIMLRNFTK